MKLRAYPKINLALDILGRDQRGFHELQTVFYEYKEIYDEVSVHETDRKSISIFCTEHDIPCDHKNACYQAARLMQKKAGRKDGLHIQIKKRIPIQTGLGGGSANAAAVIKMLNEMWKLNWSKKKLARIAANIAMDVPFFIYGGTALGTHYGEKIQPLPNLPKLDIKVEWPEVGSSTTAAYKAISIYECGKNTAKTKKLIEGIKKKDKQMIIENIHNDFDILLTKKGKIWRRHKVPFAKHSLKIMRRLKKEGAKASCLTGSGSAVIGVF